MAVIAVWMAMLGPAVDVGWRPLPEGGLEYIIQIEPGMLDTLASGEDIRCAIPPGLGRVTAYRITVGEQELPREGVDPQQGESRAALDGQPLQLPGIAGSSASVASNPRAPEPETAEQAAGANHEAGDKHDRTAREEPQGINAPGLGIPAVGQAGSEVGPVGAEMGGRPEQRTEHPGVRPPIPSSLLAQGDETPALFGLEGGVGEDPSEPEGGPSAQPPGESGGKEPSKPWLPLTLALAGFCGSAAGMFYFGWMAFDYRIRYRRLLQKWLEAGEDPPDEPVSDTQVMSALARDSLLKEAES
ncbi:MAG TPA: hypothetical protein EYH34_18235 [Planctomycetes bacterium]|nr:hypothetical protein [Planctomycetota bacterium]